MNNPLIPEAELVTLGAEVRRRWALEHHYWVDFDDPLYGAAFQHYLLFTHWPDLLKMTRGLTPQAMYYNRYYWFLKFAKLYMRKHGSDAGMEQQAFQLLEQMDCEIDWYIVEQIDKQVDQEVATQD
jgi:hypothetical protein